MVMCSDPVIRAPFSGFAFPNSSLKAINPGISCSASSISFRPKSANARSATTKSFLALEFLALVTLLLLVF